MANLPRREFLMAAKTYLPRKMTVGGWYIAEKLDGVRVFWDGGISRGYPTIEIPWASVVDPKTGRIKKRLKSEATGMWSKYGNPIPAPDWFLNSLPCMPLDGVIWAGRGNRQLCYSICIGDVPDIGWNEAEFAVTSCPPIDKVFEDGEIRNTHMRMKLLKVNFDVWLHNHDPSVLEDWFYLTSGTNRITFGTELAVLRDAIPSEGSIYLLQQKRLPFSVKEAAQAVEEELKRILRLGGQGVIIRSPDGCWEPRRVDTVLKYGRRQHEQTETHGV